MKKSNGYIITIVLLAIAIIGLGSYIVIDKVQENKNETQTEIKEETNKKEEDIRLSTNRSHNIYIDDNITIKKTDDSKIVVNTESFKNKEIGSNIAYAEIFSFSQSDICYGDSWLLMIDGNKEVTAFSIDNAVCSNKIDTKNITNDLKELGVNTIKGIYQNYEFHNQYEPLSPKVNVVTDNDKIIEITSILEER